jgi:two-component SAPR family response regulator
MVDDEVRSLCLLESILDRLRFKHLRKLTDPTRILEEFEEFQPDLIITDIEMPEMDGIAGCADQAPVASGRRHRYPVQAVR